MLQLRENDGLGMTIEIEDSDYNSFFTFLDLMAARRLAIDIEVPEHVLTLPTQGDAAEEDQQQYIGEDNERSESSQDGGDDVEGKWGSSKVSNSRLAHYLKRNNVVSNPKDRTSTLYPRGLLHINPFKVTGRLRSPPPPRQHQVNRSSESSIPSHQCPVNNTDNITLQQTSASTSYPVQHFVNRREKSLPDMRTSLQSKMRLPPHHGCEINKRENKTPPHQHQINRIDNGTLQHHSPSRSSPVQQHHMNRQVNSLPDIHSTQSKRRLLGMRTRDLMLGPRKSIEEVLEQWAAEGKSQEMRDRASETYHYINSLKEQGASITQLKARFTEDTNYSVKTVAKELVSSRMLVKVGLIESRWVTSEYTSQWYANMKQN